MKISKVSEGDAGPHFWELSGASNDKSIMSSGEELNDVMLNNAFTSFTLTSFYKAVLSCSDVQDATRGGS